MGKMDGCCTADESREQVREMTGGGNKGSEHGARESTKTHHTNANGEEVKHERWQRQQIDPNN